ncbi:hypothetical protein EDD37DRAFT_632201 [Exophiala viscosa]|uniref:Uncharacterized protein n=1 Tax=Exophiala viscosa TaxID=2486360 RepID=A0AAN6DV96_9EURO|nr:hypothetical protein EDD36DRAFT_466389 [Exophiala viscosa]KAI1623692.1 hypothetical protein EDD37DRAFT_632201 [Exophiala viscosa]
MNNTLDPGGEGALLERVRRAFLNKAFMRDARQICMGIDGNIYQLVQFPGVPVVRMPDDNPAALHFLQSFSANLQAHVPTSTTGGRPASSQATTTDLPRAGNAVAHRRPFQGLNAADLNAAAILQGLNAGNSQKIVLERLILQKDARYPVFFQDVFDADQCSKLLFLALHPVPFETIAYVLRLENDGEVRDKESLARLGNIIAHYLPQIMRQEAALKPDAETMVSDLLSRAESGVWMPSILQHATDYINTSTMDADSGSKERRKYARERTVLREWRETILPTILPVLPDDVDLAAITRHLEIEHQVQAALAREEADEKGLCKLGYRKTDPEGQKAMMLHRLVFLAKADNWRGLLKINGIIE